MELTSTILPRGAFLWGSCGPRRDGAELVRVAFLGAGLEALYSTGLPNKGWVAPEAGPASSRCRSRLRRKWAKQEPSTGFRRCLVATAVHNSP